MTDRVFQLSGTCNNYPWGKHGHDSLAARLCQKTTPGFQIDDSKPYSELWFGDYPDFPARVLTTGEALADILARNKETLLGDKVLTTLDPQLPFLPKILSIAKALPLQIHPDKNLAAQLHAKDPSSFPDPNHKPEIAIALSDFEVFAGFQPLSQIEPLFRHHPALHQFIPADAPRPWTNTTLRAVIHALLHADPATIHQTQHALLHHPTPTPSPSNDPHQKPPQINTTLLTRLQTQYPSASDPGTLVALTTLNFLTLSPGSALYIPADAPHAYLSGDIVECMARSNNVLNAAFCDPSQRVQNNKNLEVFTEALTFSKAHSKEDVILPSVVSKRGRKGRIQVYQPPMREFEMLRVELGGTEGGEEEEMEAGDGPGVMIVTKGQGKMEADGKVVGLAEGSIWFVAPGVGVKWKAEGEMEVFMAVV
ncbi:mannose-6-phosphate isomerase [Dichotomopilus funicola]|uniref:Mannose-6-phosphate isomerase n=1 Tax=Dichotomopilus funicola TaxID=1934379 RepID=A0AAN6UZB6_9PEZI|nr:mannose-6-phosphate isomerase [Dichotomopilus funicola]